MRGKISVLLIVSLWTLSGAAQADLSISNKPTHAMNCSAGVCTAKSANAVLNVGDLQTMLANGDVAVSTGSLANNTTIDQPLTWSSASQLALNAQVSVIVKKLVTVAGTGSLTITTSSGGQGGEFYIQAKASVQFSDVHSGLAINGQSYKLVADLKSLAAAIRRDSSASYALARPYDASQDGRYKHSVISNEFSGNFEGLGNPISNLTINDRSNNATVGLFDIYLLCDGKRHGWRQFHGGRADRC